MGDSLKDTTKKLKQLVEAYHKYNFSNIHYEAKNDIYAYLQGMYFDDWIDLSGRSNSYNAGDLIENPVYIIESIIRDVILTERDLEYFSYSTTGNWIRFSGSSHSLLYETDDYYNDAYLVNVTKSWSKKIIDYDGTQKLIYVSSIVGGDVGVNDKFYIKNIKGNELIDANSFDTAASQRSSWKFSVDLDSEIEAHTFLDNIAFEAQCALYKNYKKYRIVPLESGTTVGTLSNPLIEKKSNILVDGTLSSRDDIFTDFEINYAYLPQENKYAKTLTCNKDEVSNSSLSSYKTNCENAAKNYRTSKPLTINLDFIYDDTTALEFTKRIIVEKTFQRLLVGYVGAPKDHIQYEKGDLVKINVPERIPASKNNSAQFLITKSDISFMDGLPEIKFKLVEMV